MPRCKVCKSKFEAKWFNQKTCYDPSCVLSWSKKVTANAWKVEKKKLKPYTHSKEFKKLLQNQVNLLARKIDNHFNYKCIDCGEPFGKQTDGAHFHNVGGNENIRYNLHNIHAARSHCNQYDSQHKARYPKGIMERYGKDYLNYIDVELPIKYSYLGLNEVEVVEALKKVRKINREFSKIAELLSMESISMRDYFNNEIGIYK